MRSIERAFDATAYLGDLRDAISAGNPRLIDTKCHKITDPFTLQLDSVLPSPNMELTIALAAVVDDATDLQQACNAVVRSPRDYDKRLAVVDAVEKLADDTVSLQEVMSPLGDELHEAGY